MSRSRNPLAESSVLVRCGGCCVCHLAWQYRVVVVLDRKGLVYRVKGLCYRRRSKKLFRPGRFPQGHRRDQRSASRIFYWQLGPWLLLLPLSVQGKKGKEKMPFFFRECKRRTIFGLERPPNLQRRPVVTFVRLDVEPFWKNCIEKFGMRLTGLPSLQLYELSMRTVSL